MLSASRALDIAVLELSLSLRSGTAMPGLAMERVLAGRGHRVRRMAPDEGLLARLQQWERSRPWRLWRRVAGAPPPDPLAQLGATFARQVRDERPDVVIARGFEIGHVLAQGLGALRVLDWPNVAYIEAYSSSEADLDRIDALFRRESAVLEAADLVISPGWHLTRFVEATVPIPGLAAKLITVPLGCELATRVARRSDSPRIVYAGSCYPIQDPYLLSRLTGSSPFPIHCFGPRRPADGHLPHRLDYRGFAPDASFLADYQVGLITLSRDRLREVSPATKLAYYFAHGLPVLFPAWMKEGHDFPACALPYEEATFDSQARRMLESECWARMSAAALAAAEARNWNRTLAPLVEAIESRCA